MIKQTTTKEFFIRLIIPVILLSLSFGLDFLPVVSDNIVSFFRWLGVGILALILFLQGFQWILDFISDNFHKTKNKPLEVEQNGKQK
ncbi:MAG: hypothetical protein KJ984_03805 [Nanoarchaeota archaeon]|nr:hypothetical protein [Nanoarchaeota archaeon]